MKNHEKGKPVLLKAVESILADPNRVRKQALATLEVCSEGAGGKLTVDELCTETGKLIVSHYSNMAALAGGATALVSIVPGIGTLLALTGGAISDAALCLKFQVEMIWELATIYGRDINDQEEADLCLLLAGVGTLSEVSKQGGLRVALAGMSRPYLRTMIVNATKVVFRKLGLTFARRALQKAVPFGVGVGISVVANKSLTAFIGREARMYLAEHAKSGTAGAHQFDGVVDAEYKVV